MFLYICASLHDFGLIRMRSSAILLIDPGKQYAVT
jgi:hypothetical protein